VFDLLSIAVPFRMQPGLQRIEGGRHLTPLAQAVLSPGAAARLRDSLASMSQAVLNYKNLSPARDRLLRWLALSVELPTSVEREITWTEPAVKGDTSGKVLKPAKIATGFEIGVPIFVAQGDKVEIDTRTGEYRKRV